MPDHLPPRRAIAAASQMTAQLSHTTPEDVHRHRFCDRPVQSLGQDLNHQGSDVQFRRCLRFDTGHVMYLQEMYRAGAAQARQATDVIPMINVYLSSPLYTFYLHVLLLIAGKDRLSNLLSTGNKPQ